MNAVILMTRLPHPGATKTRLMPLLTPIQCAELHGAFLKDYEACLKHLDKDVRLFIAYAPEHCSQEALALLPSQGHRFLQEGSTLGERMTNAFQTVFSMGFKKAVLVGSDIPHIQPHHFCDAFLALEDSNLVFGPTVDGGYYLVGMNALHKKIFADSLKWGNLSVLEATCRIANEGGLTVALIEKQRDIDTVADLMGFYNAHRVPDRAQVHFPEATFQYIKHQLGEEVLDEHLESAN